MFAVRGTAVPGIPIACKAALMVLKRSWELLEGFDATRR